ncbi:uncharacterized protein LOC128756556 [Synchiropus splendidus]|uniref:uncharacterized protein LOC128756556 n=1 Tax=Synchiropus splendidus TaxID=270530 RepID=UPI00237ECD8B|nr:uncharacterized protein LOC128756556 [Synchiropus splendidus]
MMFLRSILLLFTSPLFYVSGVYVEQRPANLTVTEGDAVNITCCFNTARTEAVQWIKNTEQIHTDQNIIVQQIWKNCESLSFKSIKHEDAGMYVCRVTSEIPTIAIVNGPGTYITVKDRGVRQPSTESPQQEHTSPSTAPIAATLSLLGGLILLTVLCCCYGKRKRALASKVIHEVPQTDSELAEMDKHSTSSSNRSTQWYQVVVYEAVEFLESVPKTKTA